MNEPTLLIAHNYLPIFSLLCFGCFAAEKRKLIGVVTYIIGMLSLVSIHVLAGRATARDASRCMDTNDHKRSQPSQQKPASSQQSRTC